MGHHTPWDLGSPVGQVAGDLKLDGRIVDAADFTDELGKIGGESPGLAASDELERFALGLISALVDEQPQHYLRLSSPDIPDEVSETENVEPVQLDFAVVAVPDVIGKHPVAVPERWRLGKGAGAGDAALADIEPVSNHMPAWNR
jgi:hypothetical protein